MSAADMVEAETSPELDPAELHFHHVLSSQHFTRAETQKRLLKYLWEHRSETVSEYALATEALGRKTDFDSAVDASVRVHISRLRRKLKDYYRDTGEPERLTIPTGTHQLQMELPAAKASVGPSAESISKEAPQEPRRQLHFVHIVAGLLCLCVAALAGWAIGRRTAAHFVPRTSPITPFWAAFLGRNSAPVKIILPTPTFFQFPNSDLRIRSTRVNDYQDVSQDPDFRVLTSRLGQPILEQHYTVASDTLAAISMARNLQASNGSERVSFDVMGDSDMLMLERANVIALGTHQTLHPLRLYLESMNFSLNFGEAAALNAKPLAGEQRTYPVLQESPERVVRPSVIALLPGRNPGLQVLLIESRDTAAIVSLLSSNAGANSIQSMLAAHGNPAWWEMVVETELNGGTALRTWPVAMHPYEKGAPSSTM